MKSDTELLNKKIKKEIKTGNSAQKPLAELPYKIIMSLPGATGQSIFTLLLCEQHGNR